MRNRLFFPAIVFCLILQAALARSQQLTIQNGAGKSTQLT